MESLQQRRLVVCSRLRLLPGLRVIPGDGCHITMARGLSWWRRRMGLATGRVSWPVVYEQLPNHASDCETAGWLAAGECPRGDGGQPPQPTILVGKAAGSPAYIPGGRIPPNFASVIPGRNVGPTRCESRLPRMPGARRSRIAMCLRPTRFVAGQRAMCSLLLLTRFGGSGWGSMSASPSIGYGSGASSGERGGGGASGGHASSGGTAFGTLTRTSNTTSTTRAANLAALFLSAHSQLNTPRFPHIPRPCPGRLRHRRRWHSESTRPALRPACVPRSA